MLMKMLVSRQGNIAIPTALMMTPLVILSGAVVDFGLAYSQRGHAQDALDRATLAATSELGLVSNAVVEARLRAYFTEFAIAAKVPDAKIASISIQNEKGEVSATAEVTVKTSFLTLADMSEIDVSVTSTAAIGIADFDVVMVLDNSGSMGGTKIATLQTAAKDLSKTLLAMNAIGSRNDRVQIGLVPFASSVKVGASFGPVYDGTTRTSKGTGAAWLDVDGLSPIHRENFNAGSADNRFDLFAALAAGRPTHASVLNWAGCVETRPSPYDVDDTTPTADIPATLFVPMFAPDEPGYRQGGSWVTPSEFDKNYLDDNGGQCVANSAQSATDAQRLEAQGRTCKYKSTTSTSWRVTPSLANGPNFSCTTRAILPMTRTLATLESEVNALTASGNTNIHEGVMWGWRALSPGLPFDQGRVGTSDRPLKRIMIVMTDGANTYNTNTTMNLSTYGAYGYIAKNRLGTTVASMVKPKQDERTATACRNAKDIGGITIYTIAFQVGAASTISLLRTCATDPSYAYTAENNNQLLQVFQQIAKEITQLRVAR